MFPNQIYFYSANKNADCIFLVWKHIRLSLSFYIDSSFLCGSYQLEFYELLLFGKTTGEVLQLMFENGLNQLNFL